MISFDPPHQAVHYPRDRRFRIWVRPSILIGVGAAIALLLFAAWIEFVLIGLPYIPSLPQVYPNNFAGPHGFPLWVRYCHFFNFLFVMMLIRSGLSILMDHPRLYFNDDCTPGSEWIRFTPIKVPRDRIWTAKDDARYISPIVGTPGYRHTIGIARVWHFIDVHGFIATGIVFIGMLLTTEQWKRIVPTSPVVIAQAWNTFVHYATFHLPPEPNGFYGYNALQQIAYFTVVFVFGPLAILTGIAMSPAVVNHFPWYPRIFGGRQSARSIHFLTMLSFFAFLVVHVTLVVMTGFKRNMNHIVVGTDDLNPIGMWLAVQRGGTEGHGTAACRQYRYPPLIDRKLRLRAVVPKRGERLLYCDHVDADGEALFRLACEHDLEGIVAKRKSDPYLTEHASWLKIRGRRSFHRAHSGDPLGREPSLRIVRGSS